MAGNPDVLLLFARLGARAARPGIAFVDDGGNGLTEIGNHLGAKLLEGGKTELREVVKTKVIEAVQKGQPLPEVHIRGDRTTPYQFIGGVIFNVQLAGIPKVGFISEPVAGEVTRD